MPYAAVPRAAHGGRPHVLANMVGGLDGTAAVSGRVGVLSSPADARLFLKLRSVADVVLVGAQYRPAGAARASCRRGATGAGHGATRVMTARRRTCSGPVRTLPRGRDRKSPPRRV